jgi:hypothetical protein
MGLSIIATFVGNFSFVLRILLFFFIVSGICFLFCYFSLSECGVSPCHHFFFLFSFFFSVNMRVLSFCIRNFLDQLVHVLIYIENYTV